MKRASVLLLHGLCSTPDELLPVDTALRAAGHEVHGLCVPGYSFEVGVGKQRAAPFAQWLQTVADAAERLRGGGRPVVLVGLSAGASLALGAAMLAVAPVDGLVLMSTTLQFDGWNVPRHHVLMPLALYTPLGRFWQYRESPPYGVKNPRVRRWIERELAARQVSCAGAAVIGVDHLREHDRLRRHVRRSLATFDCPPVLALHARDDELASLANVELLKRGLRARSFRAVVLPDSHHMITIDNDRQQVVRETVQFVESLAVLPASTPLPAEVPHEPEYL